MGREVFKAIVAAVVTASLALAGTSYAVIGGPAAAHNFTEIPGYGFGGSACPACHKPHFGSGEKRLWTSDKESPNDGLRSLAAAKAASQDQAAGGEYAGIYLCLDCHGGTASAPSWAGQAGHEAAAVKTHSTREMRFAGYSTKYTAFVVQCTACHDTHGGWTGVFEQGRNGYMIRSTITTPNSGERVVVFRAMSGTGSMGANTAPYNSICEVCHTATAYHNNTGAAAHNDGKNCTQCHSHSGGFAGVDVVSVCGSCHAVAPPELLNHSVHLTASWGPRAACDDCHPPGSNNGGHAEHRDESISFRDGQDLANTTVCNACHGCTAQTKPTWGDTAGRSSTSWCESCHDGSSTVNTAAGTGGSGVAAPDVVGSVGYGFDYTGHGKTGIGLDCVACHSQPAGHIDGASPTYGSSLNNYQQGYRLEKSNTVPLLTNYSSSKVALCFQAGCHIESRLLGMPPEGKPSGMHVHSIISSDQWYTNFRNTSTTAGLYAGNWDFGGSDPGYVNDIPTNIHWNHMDDYGSSRRAADFSEKLYDSDGDGTGDSYVTCATCHNPHGTSQPAMVFDDFSLRTYSSPPDPSYRWLGSNAYVTTRCTDSCHDQGNASGTAGTKYYREPTSSSTVFGMPLGVSAQPLP